MRRRTLDMAAQLYNAVRAIATDSLTVRAAADRFGVSKSGLYKYITVTMPHTQLYLDAIAVLAANKAVRHIRGGAATARMKAKTKEVDS